MFIKSRWFPPLLALVQTLRHVGFIGYDYRIALAEGEPLDFVKEDLARPLFEGYGWCGAYATYSGGQSADLGLDLPAYLAGMLLKSVVNLEPSCVEGLMTPRGQIIVAALVPPIWFFVGMSVRRLAQHRWRQPAKSSWARVMLSLAVLPAIFGLLLVAAGIVGLVANSYESFRAFGLGVWMLYAAALAAERLRVWPFAKIATTP